MSILSRIGELRKQHGSLSINKLERECGLTRGSMAKWDDHAPSPDKVKKVADYFNVSVECLLYGDSSSGIKKERPADGEALTDKQKEAIEFIKTLSDNELGWLIAGAKAMQERKNESV